ncbi:hypothetical protein BHM03_00010029 [Ensete ventricosum]|nr:hypothetical protein BHM03_00010029 [Ensete ventricosum]
MKHVVVLGGLPLTSSVGRNRRGSSVPNATVEEALKGGRKDLQRCKYRRQQRDPRGPYSLFQSHGRERASSERKRMEGAAVDHLAHERSRAQFDVEAMKIAWAGSKHAVDVADRMARLVASDPVCSSPPSLPFLSPVLLLIYFSDANCRQKIE